MSDDRSPSRQTAFEEHLSTMPARCDTCVCTARFRHPRQQQNACATIFSVHAEMTDVVPAPASVLPASCLGQSVCRRLAAPLLHNSLPGIAMALRCDKNAWRALPDQPYSRLLLLNRMHCGVRSACTRASTRANSHHSRTIWVAVRLNHTRHA